MLEYEMTYQGDGTYLGSRGTAGPKAEFKPEDNSTLWVYGSKSEINDESTLMWDTSGRLVQKDTYDEEHRLETSQEGRTFVTRTQDESAGINDRPKLLVYERDGVPFKNIYYRYVEDGVEESVLVRRRETVEEYNSDGSSRFRTTIYVYYGLEESYEGNLWFFVDPEGVRRCLVAKGYDKGIDPEHPGNACGLDDAGSISDNDLLTYASAVYETYDEADRATKVIRSGDCGGCGGGSEVGTYYLSYYEKEEEPEDEWNDWYSYRLTRYPSGLRTAEFMNVHGGAIFNVQQKMDSASPPDVTQYWIDHYKYDSCGRLIEHRHPSACNEYVEGTHVDIDNLDFSENMLDGEWVTDITPNDEGEHGLVEVSEYYAPEDNQGEKLKAQKVQEGTSGTAYYVRKYTYTDKTYDGYTTWQVASETAYPTPAWDGNGDEPDDAQTTTYAYTYHKDDSEVEMHAVKTKTITYPVVTPDNNGSNSATTVVYHYKLVPDTFDGDELETPGLYYNDWTWHEDGTYSYTKLGTGVWNHGQVVETIVDANSADGEDFPSGCSWPARSGGFSLTTTYDYYDDPNNEGSLGRLKSVTDPAERMTVYAYTCQQKTVSDMETTIALITLVAPYMDGSDYSAAPIQITVADLAGRTLISATGDSSSDTDGDLLNDLTANYKNATTDLRELQDGFTGTLASHTDHYYTDGQLTSVVRWTDADDDSEPQLTTSYTYGTDSGDPLGLGRRIMTTAPDSTITYVVYDQLGRTTETWIGTDATGATQAAPDTGASNLVQITGTYYDQATPGTGESGVGDGNVTQTQTYYDGSNSYDTVFNYDFRDRLEQTRGPDNVAVKRTLDNLGRALTVETYYDHDEDWNIDDKLRAKSTTAYDEKGQIYQSATYEVTLDSSTPPDGTAGDYLETNYWYDPRGQLIKAEDPNGLFSKTAYDGAGRTKAAYVGYDSAEDTYAELYDGTNNVLKTDDDIIVEQTFYEYDAASNVWLTRSFQRYPDGSGTNDLTTSNARVTYAVAWFDELGRTMSTVFYGTNEGGDDLQNKETDDFNPEETGDQYYADCQPSGNPGTPNTSAPYAGRDPNITYLATDYFYSASTGRQYLTIDNKGTKTWAEFDDLGRTLTVVENYSDGTANQTDYAVDRVTEYVFDVKGRLAYLNAKNPKGSGESVQDQKTHYIYTDATNASLPTAIVYPDSSDTVTETNGVWSVSGSDHVTIAYDRLGRKVTRTDQRDVVHAYTYDSAGRLESDDADTLADPLPASVDNAVVKIGRAYDDVGRLQTITSYNASNTVVNETKVIFDAWGNVWKSYQDHAATADSGDPTVTYTYEDDPTNNEAKYVRLEKITYPGASREIYYNYPTSNTDPGYWLSRLANTASAASPSDSQKFAQYTYLGAGTVVEVKYPAVTVDSDPLALTYGTGGTYGGFDQFGRVVNQKWEIQDTTPVVKDQFKYGYDRASNRTWRENTLRHNGGGDPKLDEFYTYDGLDRLETMKRGTLTGSPYTGIDGTPVNEEDWTLEALGNWSEYVRKTGGSAILEQVRKHNKVNELDSDNDHLPDEIDEAAITEGGGQAVWVVPGYDAAGNMTSGPKPTDPTVRQHYKWDAWNRMVAVYEDDDQNPGNPGDLISTTRYDGLNRRIQKTVEGDPDVTYDYYYSGNQVVEVRKDSDTDPYEQYVWDIRYVHAPVLRWRDTTSPPDGNVDETLYYTNDANFNVTSLVETDGDVVERVTYDPYGKATFYDGDWANPSATSAYDNEVLYTGHRLDVESGLYYGGTRYYHPTLGLWPSRDRRYADGFNFYEYVRSSPADLFDPFGREAEVKWEEKNKPNEVQPEYKTQEEIDKAAMTDELRELGLKNFGGYANKYLRVDTGSASFFENSCCYCWFYDSVVVSIEYEFAMVDTVKDPQNDKDKARRKAIEAHERGHLEDFSSVFHDQMQRQPLEDEVAAHDTQDEAYVLRTYTRTHPALGEQVLPIGTPSRCDQVCKSFLYGIANKRLESMRNNLKSIGEARDDREYLGEIRMKKAKAEREKWRREMGLY